MASHCHAWSPSEKGVSVSRNRSTLLSWSQLHKIPPSPNRSALIPPMTIIHLSSPRFTDYEAFERRLIAALGATVGGSTLSKALGYRSQDAFRKAHQRNRLPVHTFELAGRRGRFAAATDIAQWLWRHRDISPQNTAPDRSHRPESNEDLAIGVPAYRTEMGLVLNTR